MDSNIRDSDVRDNFAAAALVNASLCTGTAPEYSLKHWFGNNGGVSKAQIVAAQAYEYADAMMQRRRHKEINYAGF